MNWRHDKSVTMFVEDNDNATVTSNKNVKLKFKYYFRADKSLVNWHNVDDTIVIC